MKYSFICFFIMLGISSCLSQGKLKAVCVNEIKNYYGNETSYEYFVSNEKDTMALSFIFLINKQEDIVNLDIKIMDDDKEYMMQYENDIIVVDSLTTTSIRKYKHSDYEGFLSEFKLCMEKAAENIDLSQLRHIRLYLTDIPEIAIAVSKNIGNCEITHELLDNALKQTDIEKSIDLILNDYNLNVDYISSDDEIFNQDAKSYYRRYDIKDAVLPKNIVGVNVIMGVKRKEENRGF